MFPWAPLWHRFWGCKSECSRAVSCTHSIIYFCAGRGPVQRHEFKQHRRAVEWGGTLLSPQIGLSSLVPLICLLAMLSVESGVEKTCLVSSVEEASKSYPLTKWFSNPAIGLWWTNGKMDGGLQCGTFYKAFRSILTCTIYFSNF